MDEATIHTDTIIQAFSQLAPDYEVSMQHELKQYWGVNYLDFICKLVGWAEIQAGECILDIATGTARIPRQVIDSSCQPRQIVGLDITYAMLAQGKRQIEDTDSYQPIRLICGSALDMPLRSASFDVILCGLGTHHIQVERLIPEMRRVLKSGGKLVFADVCASRFWHSRMGKLVIRFLLQRYRSSKQNARAEAEAEAFSNVHSVEEWLNLLSVNGFNHVKFIEINPRLPWYPGGFLASAQDG